MIWSNSELVGLRYVDGQERLLPYTYTDGQWRREDGTTLAESDHVYVRQNGKFVYAVNPVTREATEHRQIFIVTRIDGADVSLGGGQ